MKTNKYFQEIEKCGWFDLYPLSLREKIREKVLYPKKEEALFSDENPYYGLIVLGGDFESAEEEGDYTKYWINQFSESANEVFSPTNIKEAWQRQDNDDFKVTISFEVHGEVYEDVFEDYGDWINPKILLLLERSLKGKYKDLCLIELAGGAQDSYFVLTSLTAYIKAYKNNLLPKYGFDPFCPMEYTIQPTELSLEWHLRKNNIEDKFRCAIKKKKSEVILKIKESFKYNLYVHIFFTITLLLIIGFKLYLYSSVPLENTTIGNRLGSTISHVLILAFAYNICLKVDIKKIYLVMSFISIYFAILSYPIIGWLCVISMYYLYKKRLASYKNQFKEVLEILKSGKTSD